MRAFRLPKYKRSTGVCTRGGDVSRSRKISISRGHYLGLAVGSRIGHSFLRWVRTQEEMNGVPFILLTDGGIPEQMALALEVGATKAVAKPTDSAAFHDLMVG